MARTLRTESKLDPKQQLDGALYARNGAHQVALREAEAIRKLAGVTLEVSSNEAPKGGAACARLPILISCSACPLRSMEAERERLKKEISQFEKLVDNSKRQLCR